MRMMWTLLVSSGVCRVVLPLSQSTIDNAVPSAGSSRFGWNGLTFRFVSRLQMLIISWSFPLAIETKLSNSFTATTRKTARALPVQAQLLSGQ
jgi:hypothetical protein